MHCEGHSSCFTHLLASKHCPGHIWGPPSSGAMGYGARDKGAEDGMVTVLTLKQDGRGDEQLRRFYKDYSWDQYMSRRARKALAVTTSVSRYRFPACPVFLVLVYGRTMRNRKQFKLLTFWLLTFRLLTVPSASSHAVSKCRFRCFSRLGGRFRSSRTRGEGSRGGMRSRFIVYCPFRSLRDRH